MTTIDHLLGHALRAIAILCLTALFALILVNVSTRMMGMSGLAWFDELIEGLFAWMVFIGTAALWRERDHFRVGWLSEILPSGPGRVLMLVVIVLEGSFLVAMTWYGYDLTTRSRAATPILNLPTALFYAAIPIAGATMLAYTLRDLWQAIRLHPNVERT